MVGHGLNKAAEITTENTAKANVDKLVTDHLDIWTSAIEQKSASGRGSSKKFSLHGIKKLRELILELAVRGKLVPQNESDEPASVLLVRIASEKAQLVKDKKIKKPKALPEISEDEKPFELPKGWEWGRLPDLGDLARGKSKHRPRNDPKLYKDGTIPLVQTGDVARSTGVIETYTARYNEIGLAQSQLWPKGTLCITIAANIADTGILDFDACFPDSVVGYTLFDSSIPIKYFDYFIRTAKANLVQFAPSTAQKNINLEILNQVLVPCPPIQEFERIVEKVDELMSLCDALEAQTEASISAHQTLVEILLNALIAETSGKTTMDGGNVENAGAIFDRVAEHFDTLFTTNASIDTLKQTILQLAVMGKLVEQDDSDEPAAKLLERIAAEKAQLIADKKIKKQKPLPAITDQEKPFELPSGWEWCRFDDTALTSSAGWSPQCIPTPREGDNWGVLKVSAVTWGKFNSEENKELPPHLEPRLEHEVQSGDFLISRANTADLVAKAVVVPVPAPRKLMMSDKIIRFKLHDNVSGEYLNLMNNSQISRDYYNRVAGGTSSSMKNVSREQIRSLVVAFPPVEEQQRIVSKVDDLMALCDQLKARLSDAQTTQRQLTDAIVEQAV